MHRVIVSLILAPCRARELATTARRSLVISPVSSHHARRAVLVFARAKMHGHLSLVRSAKCPPGKLPASSPWFPVLPRNQLITYWAGGFPSSWVQRADVDSCHDDLRPHRVQAPFNPKKP